MITLLEQIQETPITSFRYTNWDKHVTGSGDERMVYVTFELEESIDRLESSNVLFDPAAGRFGGGEKVHPWINDVTEIRCKLSVIGDPKFAPGFKVDHDDQGKALKSGSYTGDLFFDVSRAEHAWLTDVKFADQKQEKTLSTQQARFNRFMGK